MRKNILDLTIEEFVRLICNMEKVYQIEVKSYPQEEQEEEFILEGTYSVLYDSLMDLSSKHPNNKFLDKNLDYIKNVLFDYDLDFTTLDIYNYLEYKTKGFDTDRSRILLNELDFFHCEYIQEERKEYISNKIKSGWNDYKLHIHKSRIDNKEYEEIDYKDAIRKVFGVDTDFYYFFAIDILKEKLNLKTNTFVSPTANTSIFPAELDTEETRMYFTKAIKAGYMKVENDGYKWLFGENRGQARLGYFCYKVFKSPRPINKLEEIFGVKKLSASITNASYEAKTVGVKMWREKMDNEIFND